MLDLLELTTGINIVVPRFDLVLFFTTQHIVSVVLILTNLIVVEMLSKALVDVAKCVVGKGHAITVLSASLLICGIVSLIYLKGCLRTLESLDQQVKIFDEYIVVDFFILHIVDSVFKRLERG